VEISRVELTGACVGQGGPLQQREGEHGAVALGVRAVLTSRGATGGDTQIFQYSTNTCCWLR